MGNRLIHACCVLGAALSVPPATSAQVSIAPGLRTNAPAKSMKALRDESVIKQRFDFSCGAAALATILRYGFDDRVTEQQILKDLFGQLSQEEQRTARSVGFSLLDLQRVAQARGYNAEGFRLERAQLSMLAGPAIVFIEPRGYKHFAVIRGVRGDRVYLADPSRGNIRLPMYAFLDSWLQDDGKGIVFVVEPKTGLPDRPMALSLASSTGLRPEVMSVREMLAVGNTLVRSTAALGTRR